MAVKGPANYADEIMELPEDEREAAIERVPASMHSTVLLLTSPEFNPRRANANKYNAWNGRGRA